MTAHDPTDDTLEDETVTRDLDHATRAVIDKPLDPILYAIRPAAVGQHLAVERKPAEMALSVKRAVDLFLTTHLHQIPGL